MNIGVDVGNYYTKSSSCKMFESRITIDNSVLKGSGLVVEFHGDRYLIENGPFDISMNKAIKKNLVVSVATAIALSTDDVNINLAMGLPISQFKTQKQTLLDLMNQNREIDIKLNGKDKRIFLNTIEVLPEAVGVYYSLPLDFLNNVGNRELLIIDIGGKTVDSCIIDSHKSILNPSTRSIGMLNLYNDIKNEIDSVYPEYCVKLEDIRDVILNGITIFDEKKDMSFMEKYFDRFVEDIFNFIKLQYPDYQRKVIVLSGGGHVLGERFKKYIPTIVVNNDLFANAKGFRNFLDIKYSTALNNGGAI